MWQESSKPSQSRRPSGRVSARAARAAARSSAQSETPIGRSIDHCFQLSLAETAADVSLRANNVALTDAARIAHNYPLPLSLARWLLKRTVKYLHTVATNSGAHRRRRGARPTRRESSKTDPAAQRSAVRCSAKAATDRSTDAARCVTVSDRRSMATVWKMLSKGAGGDANASVARESERKNAQSTQRVC